MQCGYAAGNKSHGRRVRVVGLRARRSLVLRASLATALRCARSVRLPLSIVVIRCDNVTSIRELHGDDVGYQVVHVIAEAVSRGCSEGFLGRLNMDTLLFTLPRVDQYHAELIASRFVLLPAEKVSTTLLARLSLEIGVTQARTSDTEDSIIRRALAAATPVEPLGRCAAGTASLPCPD